MDDTIYGSMMSSSRRIKEIAAYGYSEDKKESKAERIVAIIEKFQRHLKSLEVYGDCSILGKVNLPKLEKLEVDEGDPDAEHFVALSRSAQNLQHVEIDCSELNFLSVIIDRFPALKTLLTRSCDTPDDFFHPAPSQPNQSLEELILDKKLWSAPMQPIFDTINACPNLQRVQLHGVRFTGRQLLALIQNLTRLTHFWVGSPFWDMFGETDGIDPELKEIIKIFKNSPLFVYLAILGIWGWTNGERVEDLLGDDANRMIIEQPTKKFFGTCDVKLYKSPTVRDAFPNLRE